MFMPSRNLPVYPLPFLFIPFFLLLCQFSSGQDQWDLQQCISYALKNNISAREADLQVKSATLNFQQSKLSKFPFFSAGSDLGYSSGRNQDPTSFSLTTAGYLFNSYSLQASVDLFNWFSKKNKLAADQSQVKLMEATAEQRRFEVSLDIIAAYLQLLLTREQVRLAELKVKQTKLQSANTRKLADAGKVPELNFISLASTLAGDSASLISAQTAALQSLLQLKGLLHIDPVTPFDIVPVSPREFPVEGLADLEPEAVYQLALHQLPKQQVHALQLKSARQLVKVNRGAMYPAISLFGSLGTTFNNQAQEVKSVTSINAPLGSVQVNGAAYDVFPFSPFAVYVYGKMKYTAQLNQNFRQSIGLSLRVPIFSGGSLRKAWQQSLLDVEKAELQQERGSSELKQVIYKTYYEARSAGGLVAANKSRVASLEKAEAFAVKKYESGSLSVYDLSSTQTDLQEARIQLLYSEYDSIFKLKLLEFYKGAGVKY